MGSVQVGNPWLEMADLPAAAAGKKVIFWGCFDFFERTIAQCDLDVAFLVDINPHLHGSAMHHGYDVKDPTVLAALPNKEEYFVVISSSAFYEIIDQLKEYGFSPGVGFAVTPVLRNFKVIEDILNHDATILLSSSDSVRPGRLGGGLYTLNCRTGELEKRLSGVTRGFAWYGDNGFVVDAQRGVRIIDRAFQEQDCISLPIGAVPHGLELDEKRGLIYVTLSRNDLIGVFELSTLSQIDSLDLSHKFERQKRSRYHHHANDLCLDGDSLYVSMFSYTGNLKHNWYDGAVVEYSLQDRKVTGVLVDRLWQPHSVKILNGSLCFLDSMRGDLCLAAHRRETHFNGFIRGLDFDGKYFFVGQSIHRYFDRMQGASDNISVDAGVFVYDSSSKACRFLPTPGIRDINTIMVNW